MYLRAAADGHVFSFLSEVKPSRPDGAVTDQLFQHYIYWIHSNKPATLQINDSIYIYIY